MATKETGRSRTPYRHKLLWIQERSGFANDCCTNVLAAKPAGVLNAVRADRFMAMG